jgi:hypothetical protein
MMGKLRDLLAVLAVALIAALIGGVGTANATFPGNNGRIAFDSFRTGTQNIFSMQRDGSDVKQLTFLTSGEALDKDGHDRARHWRHSHHDPIRRG